jgi:FkbM family methyltransferase
MVQELYGKPSLNNVKIIVDCGANIGLASAYFLAKYPTSRVIGIEPDPINFILCKQNLNQFGNRVTLLNAAIWKAPGIVFLNENNLGTWASCVSAQMDESANRIQALDIFSILELYDIALIDILKIDIEGAELDIFSAENLSWLEKVRCVQIETKEEQARELFLKKLSNYGFKFSQFREIVIAEKQ